MRLRISRPSASPGRVVQLLAWSLIALALASCSTLPPLREGSLPGQAERAAGAIGVDAARHLLSRTGFGPTSAEIATYSRLDRMQAVDRLLRTSHRVARTPPPNWIDEVLPAPAAVQQMGADERRSLQLQRQRRAVELRAWWMTEMLNTDSPLTERMTLFWHNHFVSSQVKVRANQLIYRQNVLLREHALGDFAVLLRAVAKDPAMIVYLDTATNRRGRPNENFARELMELFTLGEGHYSERDVREAARAFTGWSLEPGTGRFVLRPAIHDDGVKTVLGRTAPFDGDAIIDLLLAQPRTAQWIVTKLWREFVSPTPDPAGVERIAANFRSSGYRIDAALRDILSSDAFWNPEHRAALIKSPVEFIVGTVRQLHIQVDAPGALAQAAARLGQVLFAPPNVKGWPGGEAWINSTSLVARKQLVESLLRTDSGTGGMMQPVGGGAAPGDDQAPVGRLPGRIRFDAGRWQGELERVPGLTAERLLLATAAAHPVVAGGPAPADRLKSLLFDPVYQLK